MLVALSIYSCLDIVSPLNTETMVNASTSFLAKSPSPAPGMVEGRTSVYLASKGSLTRGKPGREEEVGGRWDNSVSPLHLLHLGVTF